jgi:PII-like signaling protein
MNKITALRLYFHHSATIEPRTLLHKFSPPTVASHVVKKAHADGIEQVLVHHVQSGYLAGDKKPRHRHVEHNHSRLPHCIELIDIESKLRAFWDNHAEQLKNVRALFIPCEVPATP